MGGQGRGRVCEYTAGFGAEVGLGKASRSLTGLINQLPQITLQSFLIKTLYITIDGQNYRGAYIHRDLTTMKPISFESESLSLKPAGSPN